jgi:hypothetical protein
MTAGSRKGTEFGICSVDKIYELAKIWPYFHNNVEIFIEWKCRLKRTAQQYLLGAAAPRNTPTHQETTLYLSTIHSFPSLLLRLFSYWDFAFLILQ